MTKVSWSVFSLLHDDAGKPLVRLSWLRVTVAAAVVREVEAAGRVEVVCDPTRWGQAALVRVVDGSPTGRSLEDGVVSQIKPRGGGRVTVVLARMGLKAGDTVASELLLRRRDMAAPGGSGNSPGSVVIGRRRRKGARRAPVLIETPELHARLHRVLALGAEPETSHDAAVISLLWAAKALSKAFPDISRSQLNRRVTELRVKDWLAVSVRRRLRADAFSGVFDVFDVVLSPADWFP